MGIHELAQLFDCVGIDLYSEMDRISDLYNQELEYELKLARRAIKRQSYKDKQRRKQRLRNG